MKAWIATAWRPRNDGVSRRPRSDGPAVIARPAVVARPYRHRAPPAVIARHEAIHWPLHEGMDCHGLAASQ